MKHKHAKLHWALWISVIIAAQVEVGSLWGEETNTLEIIKQLQRRIEQLEEKVKSLERAKEAAPEQSETKSKQRLEELEQRVKVVERKRELDLEAAEEKSKTAPTVSLGLNGLVVRSADSNFLMNVHGYIQADARFYLNEHNPANDTFLLRRVRPIIEGTVFDKFDYRFMADFGSGNVTSSSAGNNALLDDAYVNARLWRQLQVQVGKYKSPVGLERLQSTAELLFIETGFATQLTPNYDLGAEVHNTLFNTSVNYAIGIFNGAADAGSSDADTTDEGKDVVGRLFFQPFLNTDKEPLRKLGFGIGGSVGRHEGPLPSYKSAGQQTFFAYTNGVSAAGQQYRIDPQFYYYWGPFGVLGEYIISSQEVQASARGSIPQRFDHRAWQIAASCFLTGDENSFRSTSRNLFRPAHPFALGGGGWGAVELVARVQQLSLDRAAFPQFATAASAKEATSWGIGLNWYLNSNVRLYLDYESTRFDGGSKAKGAVTADDEHALLGRLQISF